MVVLDNCVLSECFDLYADMLLRIAFHYVGNQADAEDIVQDAFMKLHRYRGGFEDHDHIKHWLIRVTSNLSKNMLRSVHRKRTVPLEEEWAAQSPAQTNVLELINKLDWKYRDGQKIFDAVRSASNLDGKIILMHSIYESTADATDKIIPWLKENGYQTVTVSELIKYKTGADPQAGNIYHTF